MTLSAKDIKKRSRKLEAYFSRPKVVITYEYMGRNSLVWTATCSNSGGEISLFGHPSRPTMGSSVPSVKWVPKFFPRGSAGTWRGPPPALSAEVKND